MPQAAAVGPRLSVMMFLQFFIWGSWYVTVGNYMTALGMAESIGWVYTVGPIAAIISPFFLGMVADRYFATERVLGVMHLLGGVALLLAPMMADISVENWAAIANDLKAQGLDPQKQALEYWINPAHLPFVGILLGHMLCFMPTLGLTNTLAFHNITDQEKQFPMIRVFGTIGWIVANALVSRILHADEKALPLQIAGGAGIALGLYSFTLASHAAALGGTESFRAGHSRFGFAGPHEELVVLRIYDELAADLHSARGVLRLCASLRQSCGLSGPGLEHVFRADVRNLFHAGDALVLRPAGCEVDAVRGHARLGCAVWSVLRRR